MNDVSLKPSSGPDKEGTDQSFPCIEAGACSMGAFQIFEKRNSMGKKDRRAQTTSPAARAGFTTFFSGNLGEGGFRHI